MKNLTWQNPEQLFVAQELINKVKSKCCGIKVKKKSPIVDKCSMAPFFIIIYLSMLDREVNSRFPVGSGKEIILKRCRAVLMDKMLADDAAVMSSHKKKNDSQIEDDFSEDNFKSPYYEEHYERTDASPENDVMDALENGNGDYFGY